MRNHDAANSLHPRFRHQWPWKPAFLRLFLLAPTVVSVALTLAFYQVGGIHALWFLSGIAIGVFLRLLYGAVGNKVQQLAQQHASDEGEMRECLLVIGKLESPGIAILRSDELELISIMGRRAVLPLSTLRILKQGRMLPGKFVWGKRAFILQSPDHDRLAFAIEEIAGERWSRHFDTAD